MCDALNSPGSSVPFRSTGTSPEPVFNLSFSAVLVPEVVLLLALLRRSCRVSLGNAAVALAQTPFANLTFSVCFFLLFSVLLHGSGGSHVLLLLLFPVAFDLG